MKLVNGSRRCYQAVLDCYSCGYYFRTVCGEQRLTKFCYNVRTKRLQQRMYIISQTCCHDNCKKCKSQQSELPSLFKIAFVANRVFLEIELFI